MLRAIHRTGHCFIIDCHSFPARPLPYEKDDRPIRDVELCIGTDPQSTPEEAVRILREALWKEQVRCWENDPFAGTLVPAVYRGDPRVSSIMLDVNRSWYMCEETGGKDEASISRVSQLMKYGVEAMLTTLTKSWWP